MLTFVKVKIEVNKRQINISNRKNVHHTLINDTVFPNSQFKTCSSESEPRIATANS